MHNNFRFFAPPKFTYDDKQLIGEGSFGKVFFGTLLDDKTPICVKVTKDVYDMSFEREFELLAALKGKKAIIQTFGYCDNGSMRCIVLERANGALEHLLNLPRHHFGLPTEMILSLIGDLASALRALLEMKIAHRDIKPMNILYFCGGDFLRIGDRYTFKLCDFGGGRSVVDVEHTFHTIGGTLHYMAPQMLARYLRVRDRPSMNAEKTDLWSLGITLYRCATGTLPFNPRPFKATELLKMLYNRPDGTAIAFNGKKYVHSIETITHPRWFLDTMTQMIQFLLNQKDAEAMVELMTEFATLRSRVVYNVKENTFYIEHPRLDDRSPWFMEQWKMKPVNVGIKDDSRVCVLNDRFDAVFLGSGPVEAFTTPVFNNANMTWKRQDDDTWLRQRRANPLTAINDVPGSFLLVCDRPLDRMKKIAPEEEMKQQCVEIEQNFGMLPPNFCAGICHSDLLALQDFIDSIYKIIETIERHRTQAIDYLKSALNRTSSRPTELRKQAMVTFSTRTPQEFRLVDELQVATSVMYRCDQFLVELDERRNIHDSEEDKRKKRELIAMAKYILTSRRTLHESLQNHRAEMFPTLRRIMEFRQYADNLLAELENRPCPHDLHPLPDRPTRRNYLMYDVPPGGVPPPPPPKVSPIFKEVNIMNDFAIDRKKSDRDPTKPPWIEKKLAISAKKAENMCKVS